MQCLITEAGQPLGISRCPNGWGLNLVPISWSWPQPAARVLLACLLLFWSNSGFGVTFSYASGKTSGNAPRIYVTGPGTATLSDIKANVSKSAPLFQIGPARWHLRCELVVEEGAKLVLHGTKICGDVNEL